MWTRTRVTSTESNRDKGSRPLWTPTRTGTFPRRSLRSFLRLTAKTRRSRRGQAGTKETPSPPSDGREGRGEEGGWMPLSSGLSPLLGRGARKKMRALKNLMPAGNTNDGLLVRVNDVEKVFHRGSEEIHVLTGLNLDVPRGEFLALMGPSGSGKSTLLNLIGGLDRATRGSVEVGGEPIDRMSDRERAAWRVPRG